MNNQRAAAVSVLLLLAAMLTANGQSITGRISGVVTDPTGAVVPEAPVQLTYELTQQARSFRTGQNGSFTFTNLLPGTYSLSITLPGFSAYGQKNINVGAQENVDLHEIRLTIGEVTTTIEVQAEAARVATDSSDRSVLVGANTINNLPMRGRDYLGLMNTMPGVQATSTNDRPGWNASAAAFNGGNSGQMLITLDGIANQNSGYSASNTAGYISPSPDAINEVKVVVTNFNAEYGQRSGGQYNVSIKSGSANFHGTAYYVWRHEQFNANEWFNNKKSLAKPIYRFQNPGGTIGGPVLIPGTSFNKSRTKLFFFFSYDYLHSTVTRGPYSYNMPTLLERTGDFSQTVTSTGVPIAIHDPTTGVQYTGNKIPDSQITPAGRAIMKLFPTPFTTDPTGQRQYNAQYQWTGDKPHSDKILRLDYYLGSKTTSFMRLIQDYENENGVGALLGAPTSARWGQFRSQFPAHSAGAVLTVIRAFRPNLVNEFTFGVNSENNYTSPMDSVEFTAFNTLPNLKDPATGQVVSLPHIFNGNYMNLIPNINFGTLNAQSAGQSVTNPPGFAWDSRWPHGGKDTIYNVLDNVSWVKARHSIKVGFYFEWCSRPVSVYSTYNTAGTYYFGTDGANPNDTGYAYSNLLTGAVQSYGEDNIKQINHARYNQVEWFAQDSWKVARRLTIDVGMRFQIIQPAYSAGATLGLFDPKAYDPSKSGQLLFPAVVQGKNVSMNPKTAATYLYARRGFFDPASYPANGLPYSGIVQYDSKFFKTPPVLLSPRFGFALDVFGDGKTALRGGFGVFYDRPYGVDVIGATGSGIGPMAAPPNFLAPTFYNTTISGLQTAQAWYGAQRMMGGARDYPNPTLYSWSFGIQRNLGGGIILDVAYVGNTSLYGFRTSTNDANAIAPLTTWTPTGGPNGTPNPAYFDPTSKGGTGAFYVADLIRAMIGYQGYSTINTYTSEGRTNYNALQVQLNRQFGKTVQFSANYTWAKALQYTRQQWVPDEKNVNSTRPHAVNASFGWSVPGGSRLWTNFLTKGALDGWRLNGQVALFTGTAMTINCSAQSAPIGWPNGTPTGGVPMRCWMVDPTMAGLWLPAGAAPPSTAETGLWYPFNASNFVLPPGSTLGYGNTPLTLTYGPGFENIDLALSKEFRVSEGKSFEFKAEAFNALNHFNPSNPNTSLTRNYATGANTNANFGVITTAQNTARRMALTLRFRF